MLASLLGGGRCPSDWVLHADQDACFYMSHNNPPGDKQELPQKDARAKCQQTPGADLASINDEKQWEFVSNNS